MKFLISQSAVSKDSVQNFLRVLATAIAFHVNDMQIPKSFNARIKKYADGSDEFLTRFKIRKPLFSRVVAAIIAQRSTEKEHADVEELAAILKEKQALISKEIDMTTVQVTLVKNFVSIIRSGSMTAHRSLDKNVTTLNDPALTQLFVEENTIDQSSVIGEIDKFCKKIFRKAFADLTIDDRNSLRENNPDVYKKFLKLQRDKTQALKNEIRSFVRNAGTPVVSVSKLIAHLKSANMEHRIPAFNGYIDDTGALYNENKIKLNGAVTGRIELNPNYDADSDNTYVFLHYPLFGNGQPQRIYTMDYKKGKTVKKFDVVNEAVDALPKMVKRWRQDLKGDVSELSTVCALVLELVYITSGRVGSVKGATGISSVLVKEVSTRSKQLITFKYTGKKGVEQVHTIKTSSPVTAHLYKMILKLKVGKGSNDHLMTYGPRQTVIKGSQINSYLKSIGAPAGMTLHKFRHIRGTSVAKEVLSKHPFGTGRNAKESEVNKWVLEALKKVGEKLGHISGEKVTATTAIQNYIDPNVLKDWFDSLGVRPNRAIQTAIDRASKDTE